MGQPPDARLTPSLAYDLCQRTRSAAVIEGSIANLGNQYVLGLKAVSCRTGDSIAEEQARASGKEQVLAAIDKAAAKLREKLGESRTSLERFDTPLEQASTPSIAALQAYTLGRKTQVVKNNFPEAVPFLQRAIRLDPNFAIAYAALGSVYWNIGETTLGTENARKAYELRARVSEPERFYIESTYYHYATGDLEKARQIYEVWSQTYPRSVSPRTRLFTLYSDLGIWDKALAAAREARRLDPAQGLAYSNLAYTYLCLNRLEEARATSEEAETENPNSRVDRFRLYQIAFLENDAAGMARQIQWAADQPTVEDAFLEAEAGTAAYFGQLGKSRDFSGRAIAAATQAQTTERAAVHHASAALREAVYGNTAEARIHAALTIRLSRGRDPEYGAALALAFVGDAVGAQTLADDLAKRFPEDTVVQLNYLPNLRAELALRRKDPLKAIEEVQVAAPYELGSPGRSLSLYPVYVRGEAYLAAGQAGAAASEFQKILDHRGVVVNEPIGTLAHLGLARAHALQAQSAQGTDADAVRSQARIDYHDFLTLWKDADSDIPILKQAKAEYAKLQ
jgi:tetratricopeptide (TPR) repeat protein